MFLVERTNSWNFRRFSSRLYRAENLEILSTYAQAFSPSVESAMHIERQSS